MMLIKAWRVGPFDEYDDEFDVVIWGSTRGKAKAAAMIYAEYENFTWLNATRLLLWDSLDGVTCGRCGNPLVTIDKNCFECIYCNHGYGEPQKEIEVTTMRITHVCIDCGKEKKRCECGSDTFVLNTIVVEDKE